MTDVIVSGTLVNSGGDPTPVKAYRLLPGKTHSHNNHTLEPGDVVYFTADQAEAFKDKFVAVDASPFKVQTEAEATKAANDAAAVRTKREADAKK